MAVFALVLCLCATLALAWRSQQSSTIQFSNSSFHVAHGTSSGPLFRPEIFKDLVKALGDTRVEACSGPLLRSVVVNDMATTAIQANPHQYFHLLTYDNAWKVAESEQRDELLQELSGQGTELRLFAVGPQAKNIGLPFGLEVVRIGETYPFFSTMDAVRKALARHKQGKEGLTITLNAGFDLRSCWGNLRDIDDNRVCGPEVMEELRTEMLHLRLDHKKDIDASGQSGSTIVTKLRNFIIKNAKHSDEVGTLFDAGPKISEALLEREKTAGTCWSTALAPICVVIFDPGVANWLAMRKISAKGHRRVLNLKGDNISVIDLKGPKFSGSRDGKTAVSRRFTKLANALRYPQGMWKGKDAGFVELFGQGLDFSGCGSRDAQITYMRDAHMLASMGMTDYSFFGAFYDNPDPDSCECDETSHPRFPVVLSSSRDSQGNAAGLRIAAGIIDWLEMEHKANYFSTMKNPPLYKQWYSQMWGLYFHVPPRTISPHPMKGSIFYIDPIPHQRKEVLHKHDMIIAIEKMKWKSTKTRIGRFGGVYTEQLEARSAKSLQTGSAFKVEDGEYGRVKDAGMIGQGGDLSYLLIVEWDSMPGKHFTVSGHQIVGYTRTFAP